MADQHHFAAASKMQLRFTMHFGHQRTGGIQRKQIACLRLFRHGFWHTMGRENHGRRAIRHLAQLVNKHRSFAPQALDHIFVMNNFMTHINRRAVKRQGLLNRINRPHNACAKAARRTQKNIQDRFRHQDLWLSYSRRFTCLACEGSCRQRQAIRLVCPPFPAV